MFMTIPLPFLLAMVNMARIEKDKGEIGVLDFLGALCTA